MVGREVTPTDIGKHSKLIKVAQEEMALMDVLVCGRCLGVYHFIEEFRQHKLKPCFKEPNNIRECNDTKPKIWAFLLWKATQLNNNKETNSVSPNSWSLYQTWVKMDESIRETWIVAGKTIQSFAKLGQGGLQEMPVKITKTVVNNNPDSLGTSPGRKPLAQSKPIIANLKPPTKLPIAKSQDSENEVSPVKGGNSSGNATNALPKMMKKPIPTAAANSNKMATSTPIQKTQQSSRRAKRTIPNSLETTDENVEKIVAKRFNPVRKMHEYLVKWEGRTHEQNTWERAAHLENVPMLLETFERQLARQRETRAALQAKQAANVAAAVKTADTAANKKETILPSSKSTTSATPKLLTINNVESSTDSINKSSLASPIGSDSSRLGRNTKSRGLEHNKQWSAASSTGANSPPLSVNSDATSVHNAHDDKDWSLNSINTSGAIKRKLEDSDYNDTNETNEIISTTATLEDLEEDLIPSHTVKRMKNGNSISVEVKTKSEKNVESKLIKVNGTATSPTQESVATPAKSAEVIITQDSSSSGVVKKPGFNNGNTNGNNTNSQKSEAQIRVLSKGESAISNSGIVRIGTGSNSDVTVNSNSNEITVMQKTIGTTPTASNRPQQTHIARHPPASTLQSTNIGGTQITAVSQRTSAAGGGQRTPGSTTIQRKPMVANTNVPRASNQTSPSSGRMIIPRSNATIASRPASSTTNLKNVTPEQKILQLSKSGDLKVTKKVMTREDVAAHRSQQARQQQLQRQQQSQVQIQKVQQITPPVARGNTGTTVTIRKSQTEYDDGDSQATLCPITGKILGQDDQSDQQLLVQQAQQIQTAGGIAQLLTTDQQNQIALQQDLQDIDPTLLLTNDQVLTNEDGTPLLVTGEDGTVYQVAGKNAEGQTILVTQGPDGEQQFAYVAAAEGEENSVLTLDTAVAEAVAQLPPDQQAEALAAAAAGEGGQYLVKTTQEDGTTQVVTMSEAELAQHQAATALAQQQQVQGNAATSGQLCIQTSDGSDGQEANIPAEVVQADLPSPGGTRRVVLLLQDGTFMMTEMHDDEFKALNIAA